MMNEIAAIGTKLVTYTLGKGTPIVMLGGMGTGHAYLRPGMDVLADDFQLVYYDPRGTGNSPLGDEGRVTLGGSVEDLDALRAGLGLDRLNVVGHSFGADLALCYAGRYPERVQSLVLVSPGPPLTPDHRRIYRIPTFPPFPTGARSLCHMRQSSTWRLGAICLGRH